MSKKKKLKIASTKIPSSWWEYDGGTYLEPTSATPLPETYSTTSTTSTTTAQVITTGAMLWPQQKWPELPGEIGLVYIENNQIKLRDLQGRDSILAEYKDDKTIPVEDLIAVITRIILEE